MPSLNNRVDVMCEYIVNGLDKMEHTVDSNNEFKFYAVVDGLVIKGLKVVIKFMYLPLAYAVVVLYSLYKFFDAIFLQRRELRYYISDPKRHCHYYNESYVDKFNRWLKSGNQIDTATNPERV